MTNISLEYHDTLNPVLWTNEKLKPEVRSKLSNIADAWIKFAHISSDLIKDIIITGGNCNYNYTPYSDIDLHVIVDKKLLAEKNGLSGKFANSIIDDYLKAKKQLWVLKHDIKIGGYSIEVYAQGTNETYGANQGVYSILNDKWLLKPVHSSRNFMNDKALNKKVEEWKQRIDDIIEKNIPLKKIDVFKKRLGDMRRAGIAKAGEFSVENLVFKELRNSGYLNKLSKHQRRLFDISLSMYEQQGYKGSMNKEIHEISKPAGPRPAGLSGMLSGARFSGASATATPAQVEPQPLNPPFPGMSQGSFADNARYRNLWKRPWQVRPPTSAPNQQADTEGGKKRKKKVFESLYDLIEKKRAEGGEVRTPWPGPSSTQTPKPTQTQPENKPEEDDLLDKALKSTKKANDLIDKMTSGEMTRDDVIKTQKELVPEKWRQQRQRYPTNPPNSSATKGITMGNWRESTLIAAVLQLQEMQGNIFANAKKKVVEAAGAPGYLKDPIQSLVRDPYTHPVKPSERGIGDTVPSRDLNAESGKKKRTEGGSYQTPAGPPPTGGKLSQMGTGEPGETKNYGPVPSGGKLSQIGKTPTPSMTDKDLGGNAGAATGAATGASAGSTADQASTAAASGAATGSGGGKEGSTSPAGTGSSISDTTVVGGPKPPPSGPTSTKTEGGRKSKK